MWITSKEKSNIDAKRFRDVNFFDNFFFVVFLIILCQPGSNIYFTVQWALDRIFLDLRRYHLYPFCLNKELKLQVTSVFVFVIVTIFLLYSQYWSCSQSCFTFCSLRFASFALMIPYILLVVSWHFHSQSTM